MKFDATTWYQQHWQDVKQELFAKDRAWLAALREKNIEFFLEEGFPTKYNEAWKYTDLTKFTQNKFAVSSSDVAGIQQQPQDYFLTGEHYRLVFVNGHYSKDLSNLRRLGGISPSGAIITNIQHAIAEYEHLIQPHLNRTENANVISALNAAFMTDGVFIYLPKNTAIDIPIHVLFIATSTSSQKSAMYNLRNIIVAEENASCTLLEDFQNGDDVSGFTNVVTHISLNKAARVDYLKIQNENRNTYHLSAIQVLQAADSHFKSHSFSMGSLLARDNLQIELNGAHAECELKGLYLGDQKQHIDHHTEINHNVPETISEEIYKGVLANESRAVFNGKIKVHPNAQKTVAVLRNQNLLLSSQAEVDTKPELEIYADDVKCAHGATVGEIDPAMLFYLRSRGIDLSIAYQMLIQAFMNEITESVKNPLINKKIADELRARVEK